MVLPRAEILEPNGLSGSESVSIDDADTDPEPETKENDKQER